MSHRNHQHVTPLQPSQNPNVGSGRLPGGQFASVTGAFDHWTLKAERSDGNNQFHVYVWIHVEGGEFDGKYECAVNVLSDRGTSNAQNEVKYYLHDTPLAMSEWPEQGVSTTARLDYKSMGLKEIQFQDVQAEELRSLVEQYASSCQLLEAYGHTYPDGTGLHETHMQSTNQDGAMVFYFDAQHGGPVARWVFVKFQEPTL